MRAHGYRTYANTYMGMPSEEVEDSMGNEDPWVYIYIYIYTYTYTYMDMPSEEVDDAHR
jgi:hypothetical protein